MTEKRELSLEGKIAQDADRLDALGAIGIARTFTYGGKNGRKMYEPEADQSHDSITAEEYNQNGSKTSISHFYDKLLKITPLMNTQTAKKIAKKREEYIQNFLTEFYAEWKGEK